MKILCLSCCLFAFIAKSQTTHNVSVAINQGTECPEPLSIDDDSSLFRFFPNPAKETITILTKLDRFEVKIYTLQGQLVLNSFYTRDEEINIEDIAEGIYLLEVHTDLYSESRKIKIKR